MSTGRQAKFAISKGTTWGTAVSVNSSDDAFFVENDSQFLAKPEPLADESQGFTYHEYIDAGNKVVQPTLDGFLRYEGAHWQMIAGVVGDDAVSTTGGSNTDHTMDVQSTTGLFYTLCKDDAVITTREIPSIKFSGFEISGESGQFWRYSVTGTGDDVLLSGQTNTSLGSATYTSKTLRVPFGATTFRINDESSGALDSSDNLYPNSINISFQRQMVPEFLANAVAEGAGEFNSREPQEDGIPVLTLTVGFPEFTASTLLVDLGDETTKKCTVVSSGATDIGSGEVHTVTWSFPSLRVTNVDADGSGPSRIVKSVTMQGLAAQSAPTGMTGITDLFRLVVRNEFATAYDV